MESAFGVDHGDFSKVAKPFAGVRVAGKHRATGPLRQRPSNLTSAVEGRRAGASIVGSGSFISKPGNVSRAFQGRRAGASIAGTGSDAAAAGKHKASSVGMSTRKKVALGAAGVGGVGAGGAAYPFMNRKRSA